MNWDLYFQNDSVSQMMTQTLSNNYEQQRAQEEKARANQLAQIENNSNGILRENYVKNQQIKASLPQQVAMLGAGGTSESAQIAIESDYGEGRNKVYQDKQNAQIQVNEQADSRISQAQSDYQNKLADWKQQRQQRVEEQMEEQKRYEQQLQYQREQDAYRRRQDSYAREQDAYERRQNSLNDTYKRQQATVGNAYKRRQDALDNKYRQEQFEYKKQQDEYKKQQDEYKKQQDAIKHS